MIKLSFLILTVYLLSVNLIHTQTWYPIGMGTNGPVHASAVLNNELYIAGAFTQVNGLNANRIAKWNGSNWTSLGSGLNDTVFALTVYNNSLIAGGKFSNAGGIAANKIARWFNNTWSELALGMNNDVHSLYVFNGELITGGKFTTAGGINVNRISKWNGTNWMAYGTIPNIGVNDIVYSITSFNNELIIGGKFTNAGNNEACKRIAVWNGTSFQALGNGIDTGVVYALCSSAYGLIVGGSFNYIGGIPVNNLVRWTGANWSTFGTGTNNFVKKIFLNEQNIIYLGGSFSTINNITANRIASYNGTSFNNLGSGMSGNLSYVNTLIDFRRALFAGGSFNNAGGITANNDALWGSLPEVPVLISPPNNSVGQSVTPLLDWSTVNNAYSYTVQLSVNPSFSSYLINQSGIQPSQYIVPANILQNGTTYYWRVNSSNAIGTSSFSAVWLFTTGMVGLNKISENIPAEFKLYNNYPNPFNPETTIKIDLPFNNEIQTFDIVISDIKGSLIMHNRYDFNPGSYKLSINMSAFSSGLYFYSIYAGNFFKTNRMMLLK